MTLDQASKLAKIFLRLAISFVLVAAVALLIGLDQTLTAAKIFSLVVAPLAVAVVGWLIQKSIADRTIDQKNVKLEIEKSIARRTINQKYVELAIGILA